MKKTKRALISVSNKDGLAKFAKGLKKLGFEIVSTGGTAKFLEKEKIKVIDVSQITGYPKMLDGRVKSLHPAIHGGILAIKSNKDHMADLKSHNITPIDIVVCNLYPFEEVMKKPKFTHEEAIENIDIGGPTMVRAAAKNHADVGIIVDPADYEAVLAELIKRKGELSLKTKEKLALKAFKLTARYDAAISKYLEKIQPAEEAAIGMPAYLNVSLSKIQDLRYGENPHQKGAFYSEGDGQNTIAKAKQLHGKELSFNNIFDINAAWEQANYYLGPTIAIIKHNNPCGVGEDRDIVVAYKKAYACDPVSAYGGIIASNRPIDSKLAQEISPLFVEAIIAPEYSAGALKILKEKKNLRIMVMTPDSINKPFKGYDFKRVSGGFLVQDPDIKKISEDDLKVVTKKHPSVLEVKDLLFAWGVCKNVKSNAIILVRNGATVGIGAGQMSRIDSTEIAIKKAGDKSRGSVLASDAFFPFKDNVEVAAKAGISSIIQPGGSIRDEEVIACANAYQIAMVFTGVRHFKH